LDSGTIRKGLDYTPLADGRTQLHLDHELRAPLTEPWHRTTWRSAAVSCPLAGVDPFGDAYIARREGDISIYRPSS
jgi:hypothetical protein